MLDNMRSNPVFVMLTARHKWPTVSVILILWLVITGLFVGVVYAQELSVTRGKLLLWTSLGALIISPALSSVVTAIATMQETNNDAYRLLLISSLTKKQIAQGHFYAALYRLLPTWLFWLTLPILWSTVVLNDPYIHTSIAGAFSTTFDVAICAISGAIVGISLCIYAVSITLLNILVRRNMTSAVFSGIGIGLLSPLIALFSVAGFDIGLPLLFTLVISVFTILAHKRTWRALHVLPSDSNFSDKVQD
jgi:hypothetical protein